MAVTSSELIRARNIMAELAEIDPAYEPLFDEIDKAHRSFEAAQANKAMTPAQIIADRQRRVRKLLGN